MNMMKKTFKDLTMIHPASWMKGLLYALIISATYFSALKYLVLRDWAREDYSHCYLIPFVFLYLLWEKRRDLADTPSSPSWMGLLPLVFGLGLFWLGELGGEYFTVYISLWLVFVGLLWLHLGWRKLKVMAFPVFMLLAMFPFPNFINSKLLFNLKLLSSQIGVVLLQLYGFSAYREGNVIDLGFTQLQVIDACSGLRYLLPALVLSLILAHWFKAALWKKFVLVLSTIPLAVFVNSLRIALTGILYRSFGQQTAEGFFHDFSGWLIFIFIMGVLLLEMWVLKKIPGAKEEKVEDSPTEEGTRSTPERGQAVHGKDGEEVHPLKEASDSPSEITPGPPVEKGEKDWKKMFSEQRFIVALVLLVLTLIISHAVEFREKVPSGKPFSQFPLNVGQWQGTRQFMEEEILQALDLTDYTIIDYQSANRYVDFYVAYYESQRKGESIHSPETCLPGGGWVFHEAGKAKIPLGATGKFITVNRAIMQKNDVRQVSYFWFPMRGRVLTSLWEAKLYTFWDALTRQRTDGALVRIITPVYPQESLQDAEARLQKFTKEVVPILDEFLSK